MSFQNQVTLSLVASLERQHKERVSKISKLDLRLLPVAAVYGGNASGKTNLFTALSFIQHLVVKGTQPESFIPLDPFKLGGQQKLDHPAHFEIEILVDNVIYAFSFSTTRKTILEEKLVRISGKNEKVLYHRKSNSNEPNFDYKLKKNKRLLFAFEGTRDNQLFLTNSISQKIDTFKPVYDWFKNTLKLIAPDSRFGSFEHFFNEDHPLYAVMNKTLSQLDTGITHLGGEEILFEHLPIPEELKIKLKEELAEGTSVKLLGGLRNERFIVTRKNGDLISKKLVTFHLDNEGKQTKFEISQESDGSQRIIDLLPAFLALSAFNSKKVFVVDEVDRSLHTLLIRHLLEAYLKSCSHESRSQLLFTTHNVLLMDQDILRRDEMWVTERNDQGASSLVSFSEYKDIRYDKDIKKSYLQGRLGGIPHIFIDDWYSQEEI